MTPNTLRTRPGLHLLSHRSNTIIEKLRISPEIGRHWKYGWLDLTRFGGTICMLLKCKLWLSLETNRPPPGSWNAARAFATYLDVHPKLYQNRNVIELGAGGGLPGIVAALNGANTVCQQELIIIVVADLSRSC